MIWDEKRLQELVAARLSGAKLIVVANREPYIHRNHNGKVEWIRPAGGLTAALDPVMRACGGVWIAHGSGSADRQTVDQASHINVPIGGPKYTLRRIWLSRGQEEGYYYGFSNSCLWPLCHQVFQRPEFNAEHWEAYREVNQIFADAVIEEAKGGPALVFVQDYHFALLPEMVKRSRPDLLLAHFWHIPWPNPETFRVCPWGLEILQVMLGNDLMSFHIQYHCNNFMETVDRMLECRIDREHFAIQRSESITRVRPHPISVDTRPDHDLNEWDWKTRTQELRDELGLGNLPVILGVDRIDYTKGILERIEAVDLLLTRYPQCRGRFYFVQAGPKSRDMVRAYSDLNWQIRLAIEGVNARHGSECWSPIHFLNENHGPERVNALYRMASVCVVSSLHDGMNLVAKEFVAARGDESGVLVLSRFTGAARELADAVLVNPFDVGQMCEAIRQALEMPMEEQKARMVRMRRHVQHHNIYRWAGRLLAEVGKMAEDGQPRCSELMQEDSQVLLGDPAHWFPMGAGK